jgi:hypothetical protein
MGDIEDRDLVSFVIDLVDDAVGCPVEHSVEKTLSYSNRKDLRLRVKELI